MEKYKWIALGGSALIAIVIIAFLSTSAFGHKKNHSAEDLQAFEEAYLEVVKIGDSLFHGDPIAQDEMGVKLSATGMACAMCHPFASDVHPHQFPKFQEQMNKVADLREMINWCIEKPNQGEKIAMDGEAMLALEAYIAWSHKGTVMDPGTH